MNVDEMERREQRSMRESSLEGRVAALEAEVARLREKAEERDEAYAQLSSDLELKLRQVRRLERIEEAAREELEALVEIEKEPGREGLYQACERLRKALEAK